MGEREDVLRNLSMQRRDGTSPPPPPATERGTALEALNQQANPHANRGVFRTIDDLVRLAAQGISFNSIDEISAGLNAVPGTVRDWFVPQTTSDLVTNQPRGFSQRYDANLVEERRRDREAREANPTAGPVAEVGGAILGGLAAARVAPALFGVTNPTGGLLSQIGQGIRAGGAGGALAGFGSGEGGFENRVEAAGQGAAVGQAFGGAAVPVVRGVVAVAGPPLTAAANQIRAIFSGRGEEASVEQLLRAFQRDGISIEDATRRYNQWVADGARPETVVDLGRENVRGFVNRLVNVPGASRTAAREALDVRTGGHAARVGEDVERATGGRGSQFYSTLDELDAARRTAAGPLYERAHAERFPWTEDVERLFTRPALQDAAQRAVRTLRNQGVDPAGEGLRFNEAGDIINVRGLSMRALDYIKRGLDDVVQAERVRGGGQLDEAGRAVNELRRTYIGALDAANPHYAAARAAWAGPSAMRDAMEAGRAALTPDAEVTAAMVRGMSDSEREAFRLGVSRAIDDTINNTPDGRNVVARFFNTPNQRARLEAAFDSPEAFTRFRDAMTREMRMAEVNPSIHPRAGSPTARLGMEDEPAPGITALQRLMLLDPGGAWRQMRTAGADAFLGVNPQTSNNLAPLLFNTTPEANRRALAVMQAVQARRDAERFNLLNRGFGLLGGAGAAGGAAGNERARSD